MTNFKRLITALLCAVLAALLAATVCIAAPRAAFAEEQLINDWVEKPLIASWAENDEPNLPTAVAKYGNDNIAFVISGENENGNKVTYYNNVLGHNWVDDRANMKAGWYVLTASVGSTAEYTAIATTEYRFRVFPAVINSWKVTPNIQGWTVGDEPNSPVGEPEIAGASPVSFTYKQYGADDGTAVADVPTAAGRYVLIVKAEAEGYSPLIAEVTFEIKAPVTNKTNEWKVIPGIAGWIAGETPATPVGAPKVGTVAFAYKSADGTLSDEPPVAAGDYVLVVTAHAAGYDDLVAEIGFTVGTKPAEADKINFWTVVPNIQGWTAGKAASSPVGQAEAGTVVFTYSLRDGTPLSARPTEAGNYTLTATVTAEGYEDLTATVDFTVSRAEEQDNSIWVTGLIILSVLTVLMTAGFVFSLIIIGKSGADISLAFKKKKADGQIDLGEVDLDDGNDDDEAEIELQQK